MGASTEVGRTVAPRPQSTQATSGHFATVLPPQAGAPSGSNDQCVIRPTRSKESSTPSLCSLNEASDMS